ncbi:MAG: hypothetical protein AAB665_03425 [Patescibacteria group bacterium]
MTTGRHEEVADTRAQLALNVLKVLGLSLEERGRVFGRPDIRDDDSLITLRDWLAGNPDSIEILDWIVDIGLWIGILCGNERASIRKWVAETHGDIDPKQMLLSGDKETIGRLYAVLGGLIGAK